MIKLTHKQKQWLIDEGRSVLTTALTFTAFDASVQLLQVYNGDFSWILISQICFVFARSCLKALLTNLLPQLFPARTSKKDV